MTETQGLQIRKLRQKGLGYRAIALQVGVPRDSVRNYCKRRGLGGYRPEYDMNLKERIEDGSACAFCGAKLKQKKTGRKRKFCCEACRRDYWRNHREEIKKRDQAIYTVECTYCGKIFESYGNKNRKYCCHEHYILDRFGSKNVADNETICNDGV